MYIDIHTHKRTEDSQLSIYNLPWGSTCEAMLYSIGVHPWDVETVSSDEVIPVLESNSENNSFQALGEIGLDRLHKHSWELQLLFFELQLRWANENNYPVIIHCVKAFSDVMGVLKIIQPCVPLIFHDFSGNSSIVKQLLKWNSFFSIGKRLYKQRFDICSLPLGRLFLETDDNDISIVKLYSDLANKMGVSEVKLSEQIVQNYKLVWP